MVEEFNRNVYDIIIASDEKSEMFADEKSPEDEEEEAAEQAEAEDAAEETEKGKKKADAEGSSSQPKKKRKVSKKDPEYGVSRGMFFPFRNAN